MTTSQVLARLQFLLERPNPPFRAVRLLTDDEVTALATVQEFPFIKSKPMKAALIRAIQLRYDRILNDQVKFNEFRGFVRSQVGKGGAWVWKIAKDGKLHFGDDYSTKSRVEQAGRTFPDLTFRLQALNEDTDALAIFQGPAVPQTIHEDQPLPI